MTLRQQKIFSACSVAVSVAGSFEALAYILNLNQLMIFVHLSFWVYLYLVVKMSLLYDLHFKNPGAFARARIRHENVGHWFFRSLKIALTAFWDRLSHVRKWEHFRQVQNYLVLPALIFWATVSLIYLNFGRVFLQQTFIWLSVVALVVNYWYLKEIFQRQREVVDRDVFAALSTVKLYAAFVSFASALGLTRYFCLPTKFLLAAIFAFTALLLYQALFQHSKLELKSMLEGLVIALLMALVAFWVNRLWGHNYFTAGAFLMVCYNFFWGVYHHQMDRDLTAKVFWELLLLSLLFGGMLVAVTNFKSAVVNAC
jgi:hypothetical protein